MQLCKHIKHGQVRLGPSTLGFSSHGGHGGHGAMQVGAMQIACTLPSSL